MSDNWDILRKQIEYFSKPFPREAIAFANEHRDEVAPYLVDVLLRVAANPASVVDDPDYMLHQYAMHLLASWADPRAYAPLIALGHLDKETLDGVIGDVVTETYGRCLATVCQGDLEPLKKLFEDPRASYWARGAALDAMLTRVMEGEGSRDALVQYLTDQGDLQAQRLCAPRAERDSLDVIDEIITTACDLVVVEMRERIEGWFNDGLVDEMVVDRSWVNHCMGLSFESSRQRTLERGKGYVRDVEVEMGWWSGFRDEPPVSTSARSGAAKVPFKFTPIETVVRSSPKTGRNDPCPCGSGKKYKKCCGVS